MSAFAPAPMQAVRRGKEFFVPRGAALPSSCIKCGQAATVPWRKKFYWHHPALFLMLIFPGLLIYAIVALIVRKQMDLNVPLCETHEANRKRYRLMATLMFIGCIPAGILLGTMGSEALGWVTGIGMFVVAVVFYAMMNLGVNPTRIDETGGSFRGACETFLSQLSANQ